MARPAHPLSIFVRECTEQEWEAQNFAEAIKSQSEKLQKLLSAPTLIHLGGGHDHILPLLMALSDTPVCVLNIDAHLDTRIDPEPHSGNPFRQFAQQSHQGFSIHQVGIQPFANTVSTQTALSEGEMHLLMRDQCRDEAHLAAFLARLEASLASNARVVFSLDCDALESSAVEAVSAPNHDGLSVEQVKYLIAFYRDLCVRRGQAPIFGVYEFNPLYDTVSSRSARSLSALLYDMMI
jgi:formiminoglutamase